MLYLRQGRVPSSTRADDPPALADELAALRRSQEAELLEKSRIIGG